MKKLALALIMVIFLPATPALAVKVPGLYQTQIPVLSQSNEAKEQAVQDGFLQVLIKLGGNAQIDKNPLIRTSLKRADYYVHDYSYLSETPDSSQYVLQITYEPRDVQRLLSDAKVRYWGENRPLVLVWLVVRSTQHPPDIISNADRGKVFLSMSHESKKFELPLIFPVMDMEDLNQVVPGDVTNISLDVLNDAAKRYAPDAQLIGEISEDEQGVQSQWQLVIKDIQWNWKINDKTVDAVIASVMGQLSQTLMGLVNSKKTA